MKKNKIFKVIALTMALVSAFVVGVGAADSVREVTAYINYAITMKVDNTEWNPTEDDGSAIRPIIYNNRTYLPLRALCDKLGVAVDYDGNTQTVYIGEKEWTPLTVDMLSNASSNYADYTSDPDRLFNGNGVYNNGLSINPYYANYFLAHQGISTNGKYSKMRFSVYISGRDGEVKIVDGDTNEVYKSISVTDGKSVNDIEADIKGARNISIKWTAKDDVKSFIVGDIMFK